MKVFISWSGTASQEIGKALRDWLPNVIQSVRPYFTPQDIEKGARWQTEIQAELDNSEVGIFVITKDNLDSKWLHFEAGAISSYMDRISVCPLLFGIEATDVTGPLSQFQATVFSREEAFKLVQTINQKLGDHKIGDTQLRVIFTKWWPDLEAEVKGILSQHLNNNKQEIRKDRDILEEILQTTRLLVATPANTGRGSRSAVALAHEIIERIDPVLFARFTSESFTEQQLMALRGVISCIKFHCDEGEMRDALVLQIEKQMRKLSMHLELNKKNTQPATADDDIPF